MKTYMCLNLQTSKPAGERASMDEWMAWFGSLGDQLVNHGAPFGERATVGGEGSCLANGYMLLKAENLAAAQELVKGSPALKGGQTIEVVDVTPPQMS